MKYGTHIRAIKYTFNQSRMFSVRTKLIQLNFPDLLRYQYSILWAYRNRKVQSLSLLLIFISNFGLLDTIF